MLGGETEKSERKDALAAVPLIEVMLAYSERPTLRFGRVHRRNATAKCGALSFADSGGFNAAQAPPPRSGFCGDLTRFIARMMNAAVITISGVCAHRWSPDL